MLTTREALSLPKGHPARFNHFYGRSVPFFAPPIQGPGFTCTCRLIEREAREHAHDCPRYRPPLGLDQYDALAYVIRAAMYRLWRLDHPFGDDLSAVASTNS